MGTGPLKESSDSNSECDDKDEASRGKAKCSVAPNPSLMMDAYASFLKDIHDPLSKDNRPEKNAEDKVVGKENLVIPEVPSQGSLLSVVSSENIGLENNVAQDHDELRRKDRPESR